METEKNVNLLNDTNGESAKFATRIWYVINDQNNTEYGEGNENDSSIKFETKVIKSSLCDYSKAYIFVTGVITARDGIADAKVTFKHIDTTENLDTVMNMYNLIECNYSYSITSGTLRQFIQHDQNMNNGNPSDLKNSSISFKYKSSSLGSPAAVGNNGVLKMQK